MLVLHAVRNHQLQHIPAFLGTQQRLPCPSMQTFPEKPDQMRQLYDPPDGSKDESNHSSPGKDYQPLKVDHPLSCAGTVYLTT